MSITLSWMSIVLTFHSFKCPLMYLRTEHFPAACAHSIKRTWTRNTIPLSLRSSLQSAEARACVGICMSHSLAHLQLVEGFNSFLLRGKRFTREVGFLPSSYADKGPTAWSSDLHLLWSAMVWNSTRGDETLLNVCKQSRPSLFASNGIWIKITLTLDQLFSKKIGGYQSFCKATVTPVLDFW